MEKKRKNASREKTVIKDIVIRISEKDSVSILGKEIMKKKKYNRW